MSGQYAYVGPALFELAAFREQIDFVRERQTNLPVEPWEVWLPINDTWLRLNGQWISGWRDGEHFAFRPNWLNRWKIRMAARSWLSAKAG